MGRKKGKLTWRQKEVLICIYWRKKNFSTAKFGDLLGDLGVAFATLADHIKALRDRGLVNIDKEPRNMGYNDKIYLSPEGDDSAESILKSLNMNVNKSLKEICDKLLNTSFDRKSSTSALGFHIGASDYSRCFTDLISRDVTEPVLTSITMYTELDGKLNSILETNKDLYRALSRSKLNLEIRNARIGAITIPVAFREKTTIGELKTILSDSWSWLGMVSSSSVSRYMQESMSMGLIKEDNNFIRSMGATVTDTIARLADKTNLAFKNAMSLAPKASLVVFRESFKMPTEEDLLYPQKSDIRLGWAEELYSASSNKSKYYEITSNALTILKDKTQIIEEYEGRIIPTTLLRTIRENREMKTEFDTILKNADQENIVAKVLILINAKPGITTRDLLYEFKKRSFLDFNIKYVEDIVEKLCNKNLIYIASNTHDKSLRMLYSFAHLPHLIGEDISIKHANTLVRTYEPHLLSELESSFTNDEKKNLNEIISKLNKNKTLSFDEIEGYGKKFSRKMMLFVASQLNPILDISVDENYIKPKNAEIEKIMLGTLQYSLIARDKAFGVYSGMLASLVDASQLKNINKVEEQANELKTILLQRKISDY